MSLHSGENMSKLTKRNYDGKCCCSWDECGEWCWILKDSDKEEDIILGSISRANIIIQLHISNVHLSI